MKIPVELSDEQVRGLRELAQRSGKSCDAIIQQALELYLSARDVPGKQEQRVSITDFFGLWADNPETQDVEAFRDKLWSGSGS